MESGMEASPLFMLLLHSCSYNFLGSHMKRMLSLQDLVFMTSMAQSLRLFYISTQILYSTVVPTSHT